MTATRRQYLTATVAVGTLALAGCSSIINGGGDGGEDTGGGDGTTPTETENESQSPSTESGNGELTPWMAPDADPERTRSTLDQIPESLAKIGSFELPTDRGNAPPSPLVTPQGVFVLGVSGRLLRADVSTLETVFDRPYNASSAGFVDEETVIIGTEAGVSGVNVGDGEQEWSVGAAGRPFPTGDGIGLIQSDNIRVVERETGDVRWEQSISRNESAELDSEYVPPVHTESETLYLGSESDVIAFDVENGEERWRFTGGEPVPFAVQEDTVLVQQKNDLGYFAGVVGLNSDDGTRQWERSEDSLTSQSFQYAVDSDGLFLWTTRDEVVALSLSDGSDLWTAPFGSIEGTATAVAANAVVYTAGDRVEMLSKDTGETRLTKDINGATGLAVAGGRLYTTRTGSTGDRLVTAYGSG